MFVSLATKVAMHAETCILVMQSAKHAGNAQNFKDLVKYRRQFGT